MDELHTALTGRYKQVALKHDASRLVQAVVQYGTDQQRGMFSLYVADES